VARASAETKQLLLAQGISVAMYTTFFGLVVAIPILMLQSFLQARTIRILDDIDEFGMKLVNLLVARSKGTLQDAGASKS
jgi:biopolymer transport protein ExbB/TolQ